MHMRPWAIVRWVFLAVMAALFILLAVSNWTLVDFVLPDGTPKALPLPLLLGAAFLAGVIPTGDPLVAFKDADYALLVGARPRGPGMERADLLAANA
ncbi:MAG: hypothetical protein B7Z50_02610, partial [Sphingomonadales bacterium 12-62-5]